MNISKSPVDKFYEKSISNLPIHQKKTKKKPQKN